MITKREYAESLFMRGYNCCQSVTVAFCTETGIDEETMKKLSSAFGGGIGRLREVCGAVSGMAVVIGLIYGFDDPDDNATKKKLYAEVQKLANDFKEENGSYLCRDLLGLSGPSYPTPSERTADYFKNRPCKDLVGYAAETLDNYIKERNTAQN